MPEGGALLVLSASYLYLLSVNGKFSDLCEKNRVRTVLTL